MLGARNSTPSRAPRPVSVPSRAQRSRPSRFVHLRRSRARRLRLPGALGCLPRTRRTTMRTAGCSPTRLPRSISRGRLVVLSACESAGGFARLRRRAVEPGPRLLCRGRRAAVVATRWPLEDDDAAFVMERWYWALRTGQSAAAALRQARREAREAGRPARSVGRRRPAWRRAGEPARRPTVLWSGRRPRGPARRRDHRDDDDGGGRRRCIGCGTGERNEPPDTDGRTAHLSTQMIDVGLYDGTVWPTR